MKSFVWLAVSGLAVLLVPVIAQAQPNRQLPGTRPHLPGSPPANFPEANSRTRAAQNIGIQSTDFYGKRGYPRVLGDASEGAAAGTSGAAAGGVAGAGGAAGAAGIGGGGQLGGGQLGGGNLGLLRGPNANGGDPRIPSETGITGGGFSGLVPKGFGFGGTPDLDHSWQSPLRGGPVK